jgi:D-alanine-D-alanine ligase
MERLKVLVLRGGPDREREVSLKSGASVAAALREAGHEVVMSDVMPDDLSGLETACDVVFPVLHGRWGEGGPLQTILEKRGMRFVGCGHIAAGTGMDKVASKQAAERAGVPTPIYQQLGETTKLVLPAPMVIKPLSEGSSVGVTICQTLAEAEAARAEGHRNHPYLLAEQYIKGREVTVGIVDDQVLPPIMIVPAKAFYDFDAKYDRNDTRYLFDFDLPAGVVEQIKSDAMKVFKAIGARHLSRVDFIVGEDQRHWFLEINTLPGFTDHSLLPMAAAKVGITMPALCDRLVRLALRG